MKNALLSVTILCATPLAAQDEARNEFVRDNLLAVFYHELGHALIERLELPIYGQEEDAADVAAVMLTSPVDSRSPPESSEMSVDLPQPLGPITATRSPLSIAAVIDCRPKVPS